MSTFMAVFTGSAHSAAREQWDRLDEGERKRRQAAGMSAWQQWMVKHQSVIVEGGGPLGKTKRISKEGIADTRNNLAAFVVVRADSHQAAAQLFENHPHFAIFPGDAVEVMECLPIPNP
jgi:hypothetical protein